MTADELRNHLTVETFKRPDGRWATFIIDSRYGVARPSLFIGTSDSEDEAVSLGFKNVRSQLEEQERIDQGHDLYLKTVKRQRLPE